jgi:hypothetical protein
MTAPFLSCRDAKLQLAAFAHRELAPSEREVLRTHLDGCTRCQLELDQLLAAEAALKRTLLNRAAPHAAPKLAWSQLRSVLEADAKPSAAPRRHFLASLVPGFARLGTTAVALLLVGALGAPAAMRQPVATAPPELAVSVASAGESGPGFEVPGSQASAPDVLDRTALVDVPSGTFSILVLAVSRERQEDIVPQSVCGSNCLRRRAAPKVPADGAAVVAMPQTDNVSRPVQKSVLVSGGPELRCPMCIQIQ